MASYPDFVCVGAQKAATTWLYDALRAIPGVFLPTIKELHYFSEIALPEVKRFAPKHRAVQIEKGIEYLSEKTELTTYEERLLAQLEYLETDRTTDDWYRGIFGFADHNDICGEICPCYMNLPIEGVRHVMQINPRVRVLLLVRDPIDRIWSHMRMSSNLGQLDIDLGQILTGELTLDPYMWYTDYASSISRWKSVIGEEGFRAIVFDRIVDDPEGVLKEILEYVGVREGFSLSDVPESVFPGENVEFPLELRDKLFADLQPQYDFLHAMFPEQVESWIARHKSALATEPPAPVNSG